MSTDVAICNLALGHLGDEATVSAIDPPEGSAQADHCAHWYPVARNTVLEAHAWNFAIKRIALVELTIDEDEMPGSWAFGYGWPNNCVRPLSILAPGATDDTATEDFTIEILQDDQRVIYTNVEEATLRYISLVSDTARYPALLVHALSHLLASLLAGPVIKGTEGMKVAQEQVKLYNYWLGMAKMADANAKQSSHYKNFTPGSIAARA